LVIEPALRLSQERLDPRQRVEVERLGEHADCALVLAVAERLGAEISASGGLFLVHLHSFSNIVVSMMVLFSI
jgi:hypothetical protein